MSEARVDPKTCPLCGEPNGCGAAAGKPDCWCFNVSLDKAALERIPPEAKGKACVCRRCGGATPKQPDKP
jgi:hypothetical protein